MIRVRLYSDQYKDRSIMAAGLRALLETTGRFRFECARDRTALMAQLPDDVPDVLLLDLSPELLAGTISGIREAAPACKMALWIETISTEMALRSMRLGVRGILRKALTTEALLDGLEKIQQGELWFEKALVSSLMDAQSAALSPREGQLMTLLSEGMKNKEIAAVLRITEGTVKVYLSRLFQKLGVHDRFDAARYSLRNWPAGQPESSVRLAS